VELTCRDMDGGIIGTSTVAAVYNEFLVYIYIPTENGKPVFLSRNRNYLLRFSLANAVYQYPAELTHIISNDSEAIPFRIVGDATKEQNRNMFRLACNIQMQFSIIDNRSRTFTSLSGVIHDLSGGGMKMESDKDVKVKSMLRLELPLEKETLLVIGQVMHKKMQKSESALHYQYGIKFTAMPQVDQDAIIRFISSEHRKSRARR
jgi:c-di-GMP-binding flagellar brake protein YcgR